MNEKRIHLRHKIDIDVKYSISNLNYKGKSSDISPGGIFINSADSFSAGGEILLSIKMPNCSTTFKINGYITRNEKAGFGVKFKEPMHAMMIHK